MKQTLTALALGTAAVALAAPVAADYPTRPINMIIPYGPGGAPDRAAPALKRLRVKGSPSCPAVLGTCTEMVHAGVSIRLAL